MNVYNCRTNKERKHSLKVEVMFCLADTLRTSMPGKSISNNAETAQKRTGESQYMGVFATKSGSQTIKRLPLMKENQVSKGI